MKLPVKCGTRGSPLALAQTNQVIALLVAQFGQPQAAEAVVLKTTGDAFLDRPLMDLGGKGLFTKELDEALLDGRIDLAVHSMKDLPTRLPPGLVLSTVLPREDVRDAFLSPVAPSLEALPTGSIVGTASLRRQAQVLRRRPDLTVALLRGNVQSRLKKLEDGQCQATFLAMAGLSRLGMTAVATAIMPPTDMLPAVAQGAVGVVIREADTALAEALAVHACAQTTAQVTAERAALAHLDGNCRTPIAALAVPIEAGGLHLQVELLRPDGTAAWRAEGEGQDPRALGRTVAEAVIAQMPAGELDQLRALG